MTEKELCSVLLCSISMSELDKNFYRKASSISISVFSLGLFGDVREHQSQPRLACAPWFCNTGREDVQQEQLYVPSCSTVGLQNFLHRYLAGTSQVLFSFKNKVLACTFNLCWWLIMISQFSVVVPCKSPAHLPPSPLSSYPSLLSVSLSLI